MDVHLHKRRSSLNLDRERYFKVYYELLDSRQVRNPSAVSRMIEVEPYVFLDSWTSLKDPLQGLIRFSRQRFLHRMDGIQQGSTVRA